MNKYILPYFETFRKANTDDSTAIQKLLAHYNAYIMFFAIYNGVVNYVYAEEAKTKLIKAVMKFDIDR